MTPNFQYQPDLTKFNQYPLHTIQDDIGKKSLEIYYVLEDKFEQPF